MHVDSPTLTTPPAVGPRSDSHDHRTRRVFAEVLKSAARAAAAAVPVVGPTIAGAIPGLHRDGIGPNDAASSETLQYLELQRSIERETRLYETISNVMKARHDAEMASIRNLKS